MVQEAVRAMKTFGKRERDGTPTPLPGLTSSRDEPPVEKPVMPASLRERVIEKIDPSVAATVSRDVLRRQPDGSRVNIILPPLAIDSPCISIRKFPSHRYDMAGMIENGTMTSAVGRLLEIAARSRLNVLVSGGTGSGKTTLLNAMSKFIDHSERIVTIEDAAELQLQQPHVIRLKTRPPSLEGAGQVTQRDLVWNALRMRPDRIIVGEVRGPEAFDMLQAMNTGHDGSISTVHANTARDALTRIENMVQMLQVNLRSRKWNACAMVNVASSKLAR
jgi:Flp pilus assembly CpaF family ATPase